MPSSGAHCLIFAPLLALVRSGFLQVTGLSWLYPVQRCRTPSPPLDQSSTSLEESMRPAIYGYLRVVADDIISDDTERIKRELSEYAVREGFALGDVFTENVRCSESAFCTMLAALKRTETKNVVIPSLWHFARLPGFQDAMRQHVEQETGARIWVVQGQC